MTPGTRSGNPRGKDARRAVRAGGRWPRELEGKADRIAYRGPVSTEGLPCRLATGGEWRPSCCPRAGIFPPICFGDRRLRATRFLRARHNRRRLAAALAYRSDGACTKFPGYAVMHVKMNGNTHRAAQSVRLTMAFLWAASGGDATSPIRRVEGVRGRASDGSRSTRKNQIRFFVRTFSPDGTW